jgi:limonene-1,2-epoxide hydrolase
MINVVGEGDSRVDRAWWERVLAVVDAREPDDFIELLTADAQFRFGNAPVIVGHEAIHAAVAAFFSAIASCRHRLLGTWSGAGTGVCEGEVTYTRHDGSVVSVPFANVFELSGRKIAAYRIYIDNSALFKAPD